MRMANPILTFKDVLHHLVEYARFDDEADKNIAHNLIEIEEPEAPASTPAAAPQVLDANTQPQG